MQKTEHQWPENKKTLTKLLKFYLQHPERFKFVATNYGDEDQIQVLFADMDHFERWK